jgi:arylsulfatase A-like enzyme
MRRPNILYLHSHDTGRYVQPYGYAVATPHLQRFAEEGVLFRQAFCVSPTCSPSRAGLLTGTYPHQNGMIGLAHLGARLREPGQHLAHFLSAQGYETALAGVHHETAGRPDTELGYQECFPEPAPSEAPDPQREVARWAAEFLGRDRERPFFLSCGFVATHRTGPGGQGFNEAASPLGDPRYVRPPEPLPDLPEIRRDFADFRVAAARLDAYMGVALEGLEAAGIAEDTLVILTTDHGIGFPRMKGNLTDHGTGVMLMLRGPGGFTGGQVCDSLVTHLDVFPTLCEVADLPAPSWLEGQSLLPLVTGERDRLHETVFGEINYHAAPEPLRTVRTERYRYVRRFLPRPGPVLPNCDDCVSKQALLGLGWGQEPQPAEELYDLVRDPHEACNRAGEAQYAAVRDDLRRRLREWMAETADPLLTGRLDPWPGMKSTAAEGDSPQVEMGLAEPILVPPLEI